ncbi:MAG: hypothetical protein ACI8RD_003528 [Bacillariaceae sp.]
MLLENHILGGAAVTVNTTTAVLEEAPAVLVEAPAVATTLQIKYRRMRSVLEVERNEVVEEMEQIQIEYRRMGSELEVEHKKRTEVVGEMEHIRSPAVATMLQIKYRRMRSELEVERIEVVEEMEQIQI